MHTSSDRPSLSTGRSTSRRRLRRTLPLTLPLLMALLTSLMPIATQAQTQPTATTNVTPTTTTTATTTATPTTTVPTVPTATATTPTTNTLPFGDLGDAPDSTNSQNNAPNTAYTSVPGRFPTVWGTPNSPPSGPLHATEGVRLGFRWSREKDADQLPDADGKTNILNGGDNADNDEGDDGWINRNVAFENCRQTELQVVVSRQPDAQPGRMFLNVWFDGNRDGDWADASGCTGSNATSFEWIVQNFVIDMNPAVTQTIVVPTFLVLNQRGDQANPAAPAWVRFTLSEQQAIKSEVPGTAPSPDAGRPDGRGPLAPNTFLRGETEDYLYRFEAPPPTDKPGQITMRKFTAPQTTAPLRVGNIYSYTIEIQHDGGTAPATLLLSDTLPAEVRLAGGPFATTIISTALGPNLGVLLPAGFDPGAGPAGLVRWQGSLAPGGLLRVQFAVRIVACPQPTASNAPTIINVARLLLPSGQIISSDTATAVNCESTDPTRPEPRIVLEKRVVGDEGEPRTAANLLPGREVTFLLKLTNGTTATHTLHISDTLPPGLSVLGAGASAGTTEIISGAQIVAWDGTLPPGGRAEVKIRARQTERARCDESIVNVAQWAFVSATGIGAPNASNPVEIRLACRDLGDAPDSSNNFGVPMSAYPGVQANFPTVFTGTVPGPVHTLPQPLTLGPSASSEDEADVGFDSDLVNNIAPRLDRADLDQRDDGLLPTRLELRDCAIARIGVQVNVTPAALDLLKASNNTAYINVWLDSNRDGDWEDPMQCATPPVVGFPPTYEHIVVDYPINVATLGAGLHQLVLTSTSVIAWPAELAERGSWMRITLSERPSAKTVVNNERGDGRGFATPFKLGETEDYLVRLPKSDPGQPSGADPTVRKRGYIYPSYDPRTNTSLWRVDWIAEYANLGFGTATGVVLRDTLDGPQTKAGERAFPTVPLSVTGTTISASIGLFNPGTRGHLAVQTTAPFNTPPGTVLTNTAVITAPNDTNPVNNTSVATVTVPLLPPQITFPTPGTTCTGTVTITGRAQPGVTVDLFIDGTLATSLAPNANGVWAFATTLSDGTHTIHAIARIGGLSSEQSLTVKLIVDSSLAWSPISLRFTDAAGFVTAPRDREGRTDETGWQVRLRPSTTYTVSVRLCCEEPSAQVTLDVPGVGTVSLTDPDGDRIFEASFKTGDAASLNGGSIRICVTCNLIRRCSDGTVLIDPEGVVYDVTKGKTAGLLAGATVSCYQSDPTGAFTLWPASSFDQVNPQTTAANGYFSFFTPAGTYRLEVTRTGYQPYRSPEIVVVDKPVEFNVPLTPDVAATPNYTVTVSANGFEPSVLRVPPGAVIAWVNVGDTVHTVTGGASGAQGTAIAQAAGTWDSGLLTPGSTYQIQTGAAGSNYSFTDQQNPTNSATVLVETQQTQQRTQLFLSFVGR